MEGHFTLVYHEYRGSGRSGRADPSTYRFEQLAADLDALRSFLGHDRIAVLAHSLGGFVALRYALHYGQHLQALVLVATTPCGSMGRLLWPTLRVLGGRRVARLLAAAAGYGLCWAWRPEGPARRDARHRLFGLLQEGQADRMELVRAAERAAAIQSDNAQYLEAEAYRTDLTPHLHHIRCPVLMLCGSQDAVFYAAMALYRKHCPSARIVTFPGLGHHPAISCKPSRGFSRVSGRSRSVPAECKVIAEWATSCYQ
ncbi:MAG: alpha/beta hydrolase [Alicyclobacillaceae bacterium]|nr:alpha/beta hydrolase [Alicyclobacillaceae bacterium]